MWVTFSRTGVLPRAEVKSDKSAVPAAVAVAASPDNPSSGYRLSQVIQVRVMPIADVLSDDNRHGSHRTILVMEGVPADHRSLAGVPLRRMENVEPLDRALHRDSLDGFRHSELLSARQLDQLRSDAEPNLVQRFVAESQLGQAVAFEPRRRREVLGLPVCLGLKVQRCQAALGQPA